MAYLFRTVLILTALVALTMANPVFTKGSGQFALDFFRQVVSGNENENVIISPLSVQTAVGLAYIGSAGRTAEQIATGLHLPANDRTAVGTQFGELLASYENHPQLKIANKIYVAEGYHVQPAFNEIATKQFRSEAQNLDFKQSTVAAGTINGWVEEKTNNKIHDLISPSDLDADTRLVLVNAVYFKGDWATPFPKEATHKADFYTSETDSVKVDMMSVQKHFKYGVFEDLDATAIELPYANSSLSFFVLLPNSRTGLKALEQKLPNVNLLELTKTMFSQEVSVKLPKFKIEFSAELKDVLTNLGMGDMFANTADFSNLLQEPEPLKVSKVIHKAFIEVNEEGAEAAAATGIVAVPASAYIPRKPKPFHVDRPFLFGIRDTVKGGASTFSGQITHF